MILTDKEIKNAYKVISSIIEPTPLVKNLRLSSKYDCNIFLKLENMLPVGSFKLRGALYKISQLSDTDKKRGVIAVSAGNHAQGVAWAAARFGIKAIIFMPEGSPLTKIENTRDLGATVILKGKNFEESYLHAIKYDESHNLVFIHPFEDQAVIAGQSTIGTELLSQIKKMDYVIGSIGGGGLVSGLASVLKAHDKKIKIIGAQALGASSMINSLKKNKVVHQKKSSTFADGIKVKRTSEKMFGILKNIVDIPIAVNDDKIARALLALMEKAHIVAEGAGALPLAAFDVLYNKNPKQFKNKNIVLIICGGNIDVNILGRIIDKGLINMGRRVRIQVQLNDEPGELSRLTSVISDLEANVLQVIHDNHSPHTSLSETIVDLTIETKGPKHLRKFMKLMKSNYSSVRVID